MNIYTLKDEKRDTFHQPFFLADETTAYRAIINLKNDPNSELKLFPDQFTLYHLGTYDEETGTIKPSRKPLSNCKEIDFQENKQ